MDISRHSVYDESAIGKRTSPLPIDTFFFMKGYAMTIEQASRLYSTPIPILEEYAAYGLIQGTAQVDGSLDCSDESLSRLGLIDTLLKSGFSPQEVKQYLMLTDTGGEKAKAVHLLKRKRHGLLDAIHEKQKLLGHLDYLIREMDVK